MGWVRVEDDFYDNPKIMEAGGLAVGVWFAALGWCNRNLTDGVVPARRVGQLLDYGQGYDDSPDPVGRLVEVGLFHAHGHDCAGCVQPPRGSYVIHDYLHYQPARAEVEAKNADLHAKRSEAGRRGGRRSAEVRQANGKQTGKQTVKQTGSKPQPPTPTPTPTTPVVTTGGDVLLVGGPGGEPSPRGGSGRSQRGTRITEGWMPARDTIDAIKAETGATREQLQAEHRKFTDHWLAAAGQRGVKRDWEATWRNWMRRAAEQGAFGRPSKLAPSEERHLRLQALKDNQPTNTNQARELLA